MDHGEKFKRSRHSSFRQSVSSLMQKEQVPEDFKCYVEDFHLEAMRFQDSLDRRLKNLHRLGKFKIQGKFPKLRDVQDQPSLLLDVIRGGKHYTKHCPQGEALSRVQDSMQLNPLFLQNQGNQIGGQKTQGKDDNDNDDLDSEYGTSVPDNPKERYCGNPDAQQRLEGLLGNSNLNAKDIDVEEVNTNDQ